MPCICRSPNEQRALFDAKDMPFSRPVHTCTHRSGVAGFLPRGRVVALMNRGSRIILGVAPPLLRQAALGALVVRSAGTNDNTNREEDHISLQTFGVKETFMPRWINRTLVVLLRKLRPFFNCRRTLTGRRRIENYRSGHLPGRTGMAGARIQLRHVVH